MQRFLDVKILFCISGVRGADFRKGVKRYAEKFLDTFFLFLQFVHHRR
jgi:hypothetical protein